MSARSDALGLDGLAVGSHVCWSVEDPDTYVEVATRILREGRAARQKPVVFGPEGSPDLLALSAEAAFAADPGEVFLGGGPLVPSVMFEMFRLQAEIARAEGFVTVRVVADMDWLLPLRPTPDEIVSFELLLDAVAKDLGATVVCAYRRSSFDLRVVVDACCVHPLEAGLEDAPQFRFHAGDVRGWKLTGEVDHAVAGVFSAALGTAADTSPCVVDVSGLSFIDVSGMRIIAEAAANAPGDLQLVGATDLFHRVWHLGGFEDDPQSVQLVA